MTQVDYIENPIELFYKQCVLGKRLSIYVELLIPLITRIATSFGKMVINDQNTKLNVILAVIITIPSM